MKISQVAILANPISGKGQSIRTAEHFRKFLNDRGLNAEVRQTEVGGFSNELLAFIKAADLLLLAGGDGTLMHHLPLIEQTAVPLYMLPTGNESLFAKQFKMTRSPEQLLQAIEQGRITKHYLPEINDRPFFTMVSIGLDSQVIELLAKRRTGPVTRLTYLFPTLQAAFFHHPPLINLTVDGTPVLQEAQGFLVIANSRQYALGIGFVPEADSRTPTLSARFFPYRTLAGYLTWCLQSLLTKSPLPPTAPYYEGTTFELSSPTPHPIQADGEPLGTTPALITIPPRRISILTP